MRISPIAAGAAMFLSAPAAAQLRPLVEPPASAEAARRGVDVFLLNEGSAPVPAEGPAELDTVAGDGTKLHLILATEDAAIVQPGAFARRRYRLAETVPAVQAVAVERVATDSSGSSSAFVDRFATHEPIYGAFGTGDAGGKLQLSFAFRALGREDGPNLRFAYTHTMFWALGEPSGPFRATNFSPEVYVDLPLDRSATLGLGYRHDSNGLGTAGSIDVNRVFVRGTKRFGLGDGWDLEVTPEAWFYVGRRGIASDLDHYWGHAALGASIGQRDGLKLAVAGRGFPYTGKGTAEAYLSYPLVAISNKLPPIYLFGQAFSGYGEAISDYRDRHTHVRLGIAFTR